MTPDDAILRGSQFVRDHLIILREVYGEQIAMAYAGSMAAGVRNYIAERHGPRAAFDLLAGLNDDLLAREAGR